MNGIMCVERTALTVRPIEIDDAERLARMFGRLSRDSAYFRFFSPMPRLEEAALIRLADVDHCRRDALVVLEGDEIVAEARYDASDGETVERPEDAEIAVTVEDTWQRRGVGSRLIACLAAMAKQRGYARFSATMLAENRGAIRLVRRLSPDATFTFAEGECDARIPLTTTPACDLRGCEDES